jgi:hypothetical protein
MFGPMLNQAGKVRVLHQLFLALEMHARELNQPVKYFAHLFPSAAVQKRQAQFVRRVHQNAVLVVQGANAHRAGVVPG